MTLTSVWKHTIARGSLHKMIVFLFIGCTQNSMKGALIKELKFDTKSPA